MGGEGYDDGRAIAVTPGGIAYVAGSTGSQQFPWSGAPYQGNSAGGVDIWLARFDCTKSGPDSVPVATYFGGRGQDEVRKMAIDADGKLWLTGYTLSDDFPITGDAYQNTTSGDGGDVFVSRVDMSPARGQFLLYSTYFGGSGGDVGYGIAPDDGGNVWITGYTISPDLPVTSDAVQGVWPGGVDVFAANSTRPKPAPARSSIPPISGRSTCRWATRSHWARTAPSRSAARHPALAFRPPITRCTRITRAA
jgi:hypothetical protein